MMTKSIGELFLWFKRRAINWVLASAGPQQCLWAFEITGGGTGTDAVLFASQSMGGATCPDMADTTYHVVLGETITSADPYVDTTTKTTAGFSIKGLTTAEKVAVVVVGRAAGMPTEL